MRMVVTATKNPNVGDVIGGIAWKVQAKGVSRMEETIIYRNIWKIWWGIKLAVWWYTCSFATAKLKPTNNSYLHIHVCMYMYVHVW